jgi:hypothetical protein
MGKSFKICVYCNESFLKKRKQQKLCSVECFKLFQKTDISIELKRTNGRKGGIISASKQLKRSKGEIYFSELCMEYFGKENVLCNQLLFKDVNNNFWDADIVISSIKTAILYNGIWHYQKVNKNHKLNAVQSRDKIKQRVILNNGYDYYIIKDMGSFKKSFVEKEFYLFIHKLKFKITLQAILDISRKHFFFTSLQNLVNKVKLSHPMDFSKLTHSNKTSTKIQF